MRGLEEEAVIEYIYIYICTTLETRLDSTQEDEFLFLTLFLTLPPILRLEKW